MSNSQQDGVKRELPTVLTNRLVGALAVGLGMLLGGFFATSQPVGPIPPSSVLKAYSLEHGAGKLFDVRAPGAPAISELNLSRATELMSDAGWELNTTPMEVIARLEFKNGKAVLLDSGHSAFSIEDVQGIYFVAERNRVEFKKWIEKEVVPLLKTAQK